MVRVAFDACVISGDAGMALHADARARADVAVQWLAAGKVPVCILVTGSQEPPDPSAVENELCQSFAGAVITV